MADAASTCLDDNLAVEYADGLLSSDHAAQVERHLDDCSGCRRHLSSLVAVTYAPETVESDAAEPGERIGRYLVIRPLGRGAMGEVLLAYDPELDRRVAVKLLRPELWAEGDADGGERLRTEAQAMARLAHPNVVRVYDVGRHHGRLFVAMEHIDGATLARWATEERRSYAACAEVCVAAGRGLAAAHAAGVVHRDVKPANVLVGRDGRVLVTDFGLARMPAADAVAGEAAALVGTPAYMAPELYDGRPADASADQFAFAVTAWRVMTGEHPFGGGTFAELATAARSGRVRPPPPGVRLPARARTALECALDPVPDRRFESMDALLAELAPARRRTRLALAAGAVAVAVIGLLALRGDDVAERCRAAAPSSPWGEAERRAVERAFSASGRADAAAAFKRVDAEMTARAAAARAMHGEVCTATHEAHTQSPDLFDRRMSCLERRRTEAAAMATELARATTGLEVDRAVSAAVGLATVGDCENAAALLAAPAPAGPKARAIEADLATSMARSKAGRYPEAREIAGRAVTAADALGNAALSARARGLLGEIEIDLGEADKAEATLRAAAEQAARAGDDETSIRAFTMLAFEIGSGDARTAEGLALAWAAELAAERTRAGPAVRGLVVGHRGAVLSRMGDHKGGLAAHTRALELYTAAHGAAHPMVGRAHINICSANQNLGRYDEAVAACARGEKVLAAALGSGHHHVGVAALNAAIIDAMRGQYAAAEAAFSRAVTILEGALGRDHPHTMTARTNLANVYYSTGRHDRAVAIYREVIAAREARDGPDHPDLAMVVHDLGMSLYAQGDHAGAEPYLARAASIIERALGPTHPRFGMYIDNLGKALTAQKRFAEAARHHRRALAVVEAGGDSNGSLLADALTGLGHALVGQRKPAEAIPILEKALAQRAKVEHAPRFTAATRFILAQALWDSRRDRRRALTLAAQARAELTSDPGDDIFLGEVTTWIERRQRVPRRPRSRTSVRR